MVKYFGAIIFLIVIDACFPSQKASKMFTIEKALFEFYDSTRCKKVEQSVILGYMKTIRFDTIYTEDSFILGKISDLDAKAKSMQNQVSNGDFNLKDISIPLKNFKIYQFMYDNGKSKNFIPIAISDEAGNFKIKLKIGYKFPLYLLFSKQNKMDLNGFSDVLIINKILPTSPSSHPH